MSDNKGKIKEYKQINYVLFFISMKFKMEKFLGRFIFKNKLIILLPLSEARLETAADHQKYSTEDLRQEFYRIQTEQWNMRFKGTIRVNSWVLHNKMAMLDLQRDPWNLSDVEETKILISNSDLVRHRFY